MSGAYFSEIRLNARERNMTFEITTQQIWDMYIAQGRKCALTGVEIGFAVKMSSKNPDLRMQTASLDRIDSTKGYTIDNVWWLHKDVNRMKNAYPLEEFLDVCHRVAKLHENPNLGDNPEWTRRKNARVN